MASQQTIDETKAIWRNADAVCFDVDSTVCKEEGLDELAKFCGKGEEVANWTKKAMGGSITFRVALTERLNLFRPSQLQIMKFKELHPLSLTPGIKELVKILTSKQKDVYLVSGGFRALIEPVASELGLPVENVHCNKLLFNSEGNYIGFDENQPTSASGGKTCVVAQLIEKNRYKSLVMIGDGMTDFEACPPAAAFIGFGGNIIREKVKQSASWFVTDMKELINELQDMNHSI
ncbi:phosphoserine phosphatase-like [Tubulanus polymorphus]|uniref:phosphoserine phosphatase-like n=1 Tax=Tubulanus polymorphus TaxID=672921 RepID=UPI003DA23872